MNSAETTDCIPADTINEILKLIYYNESLMVFYLHKCYGDLWLEYQLCLSYRNDQLQLS